MTCHATAHRTASKGQASLGFCPPRTRHSSPLIRRTWDGTLRPGSGPSMRTTWCWHSLQALRRRRLPYDPQVRRPGRRHPSRPRRRLIHLLILQVARLLPRLIHLLILQVVRLLARLIRRLIPRLIRLLLQLIRRLILQVVRLLARLIRLLIPPRPLRLTRRVILHRRPRLERRFAPPRLRRHRPPSLRLRLASRLSRPLTAHPYPAPWL